MNLETQKRRGGTLTRVSSSFLKYVTEVRSPKANVLLKPRAEAA